MATDTIKFKRGTKNKLDKLSYGEPAFISDEGELYIGTESGVEKLTRNKEVEELSSQLAQQIKQFADTKLNEVSKNNSCVTIIFDDIPLWDYTKLFPILKEKNIKIGQACLTDWVGTVNKNTPFATWEQIKEMSDYGNEIISHGLRQDTKYTTMTDTQLDTYFRVSKETLRSKGYYSDLIVYTWGDSDTRIRKFARKYYKAGFSIYGSEPIKHSNASAINTYDIARVGLNGEDSPQSIFPPDTDSLEYLKARVDYAKANNQWLVFMGHSFMFNDTTKDKATQFAQLIDYIKEVGLSIVTPSVGLEKMGNVIDIVANEDETKYYKLTSKGQVRSNINDVWDVDSFDGSNLCTDFRYGITVTSISTNRASTDDNLPSDVGGVLVNFNPFNGDLGYQEYVDAYGLRWQRNVIDSNATWSPWLNVLPPKLYNTDVVVPSITVPAKTSYNYAFSTGGALSNINNASIYPTTNVENGLTFTHWITPADEFIIRFSNFTDMDITTSERIWKLTSIQLRN